MKRFSELCTGISAIFKCKMTCLKLKNPTNYYFLSSSRRFSNSDSYIRGFPFRDRKTRWKEGETKVVTLLSSCDRATLTQEKKDPTDDKIFVCFPGVTTHCGCIFTAR